uniref:Uncharacterized protein n=1 Tax=Cacopsylla melanoneura TaxID=428564 RepID=A0A8D8WC15_9HEMI
MTSSLHILHKYSIRLSSRFLFLGSPRGYVRTFYVEAFANPTTTASLSWVRLRLIFPYLWRTLHKTIPERKARPLAQPTVPLVNCYRAHVGGMIAMVYAETKQILFTAG